jgi:choline-sulfatase
MKTDRPNILLLMTDQQRPDSLGCYGSKEALTPNLDALAEAGVVFDNCYVSNPVCCPSRYSLCTGRYPHNHGVTANWKAPHPWETSFGHVLSRHGYQTAAIGKMHFTPWFDRFGFDGRVIAEAKFHTNCDDDYERFLRKHGTSRAELYDFQSESYIQNCTAVASRVPVDLHIDSFVGASVCEYIEKTDGPFFLFASFLSPHNPYDPPAPYDTMFDDVELPLRNMGEGETSRKPDVAYNYINERLHMPYKSDEITEVQVRAMKKAYYGLNTLVDDWIGRIIRALKDKGIYENTVILYTSDHGDLLGDHGLFYKQCFYEQSVKAPLIIHAPERFAPGRSAAMVENIDIFSTVCDLGCADPGEGRQGISLLPLLENSSRRDGHRAAAFSENYFGRMVRWGDWKMIYYPGRSVGELYNLNDDPDEQDNLWDALHRSEPGQTMKNMLLEWAFTSEDPLPLPVRPGHQDVRARQYVELPGGHTAERGRQDWFISQLDDLHVNGAFSRPWHEGLCR